jgi:hypothetical protein
MRLAMCKMGRLDRVAGSKGAAAAAMSAAFKVMITCVTVVALGNARVVGAQGSWQLLVPNSGLSSMHTAVTRFNTVVFLERTNQGATSLKLPGDDWLLSHI